MDTRQNYTIRVTENGRRGIENRAAATGVSGAEMARRMLAYAAQHMPDGWHPAGDVPEEPATPQRRARDGRARRAIGVRMTEDLIDLIDAVAISLRVNWSEAARVSALKGARKILGQGLVKPPHEG